MNDEAKGEKGLAETLKDLNGLEKVAVGTSGAVFVAFIVFWAFQVRAVIELLQLAYG